MLFLTFHELADDLQRYQLPEGASLKIGQLTEISKAITTLESRKLPVPEALRNLKTELLLQTHHFEAAEGIFELVEQETAKVLAKIRGVGKHLDSSDRDRKPRRRGDFTSHSVLRECILKSLSAHGGRAKATAVLDELGEMLQDKFTPADLEWDVYNKNQPIWRRNACLQRRKMVQEGLVLDDTSGGYWELTPRFTSTLTK